MSFDIDYTVNCWNCMAEFDLMDSAFCNHFNPTKICPFCLRCYCAAPKDYKNQIQKKYTDEFLQEKDQYQEHKDLKLGEILIKAGKITNYQLGEAIIEQELSDKRLGEIFVQNGILTREEITIHILEQKAIEKTNLKQEDIDYTAVNKVGVKFCLEYRFIPLELSLISKNEVLRFAIPSKEQLFKIKLSKKLDNFILIPFILSEEEITEALQRIKNHSKGILLLE